VFANIPCDERAIIIVYNENVQQRGLNPEPIK
jgi:hypothetical protein